MLGHELRNPLASLRYGLELLKAGSESEQDRVLAAMTRQLDQMTRLVDDLLDTARIAHGKLRLRQETVELGRWLEEVFSDFEANLQEHDVKLERTREALFVQGDPVRLTQVVGNLLRNAVRYTPTGGTIRVELSRTDTEARLQIRDSGIGMDPESLQSAFEPFRQARRSKAGSEGLGLGLPLARSLVELHGGTLSAESAGEGKGTGFTIVLPLCHPPGPTPGAATRSPSGRITRRILVIDDHRDSLKLFEMFLRADGHQITTASDAEQGLTGAREADPEVVFCDIALPGPRNGFDLARSLKQHEPRPYLVAISGYGGPEERQLAREAGFNVYLTKPIEPAEIRRIIEDLPSEG